MERHHRTILCSRRRLMTILLIAAAAAAQFFFIGIDTTVKSTRTSESSSKLSSLSEQDSSMHPNNGEDSIVYASNNSKKYSYAFLLGGCNVQDGRYRGMLYGILVASHMLRTEGSKADVVVFVQMSIYSRDDVLPKEDIRLLNALGVIIKYLPKPAVQSFHQAVMQKFRVLTLVEYSRVLFLDTDVMPLCNLDYLFELSDGDEALIKENLVIAFPYTPANAGFFMLKPGKGEFEKLRKIVETREEKARNLPYPHFDENEGWGHVFEPPDGYVIELMRRKREIVRKWNFRGAFSDQGLLYHWVKYEKKSATLVTGSAIENWSVGKNGTLQMEQRLVDPLRNHSCLPNQHEKTYGFAPFQRWRPNTAPYRDHVHFAGPNKPWTRKIEPDVSYKNESTSAMQWWFHTLRYLDRHLNMSIDVDKKWDEERLKFQNAPFPSGTFEAGMTSQVKKNQTVFSA